MRMQKLCKSIYMLSLPLVLLCIVMVSLSYGSYKEMSEDKNKPQKAKPFVVKLDDSDPDQPLLTGPPQTKGFHSGKVILQPGKEIGFHNTERYEEVIVVLEGKGQAISKGNEPLDFEAGCIVYVPPHTEHNMKNTGTTPLKYIYIVAPTE